MKKTFFGLLVLALSVVGYQAFADTTSSILPTGEGYSLQWTTSTGTTHYLLVDESTCNGLTDYVQTTTVGQRDAYTVSLSSVPDGSTITNIALTPCASRVNAGGANPVMKLFYRYDGVNSADGGSYSLTGTTPAGLGTTNFALSKVKSSTTTLQVGAVLSSGTKGARLSQLATVITYTPSVPAAPSSLSGTQDPSLVQINLSWTDNASNETAYAVERKLSTSGTYTQIASTSANTVSYNDSTVASGATYNYRVRGYNSSGYGSYSNVATATAPSLPSTPSLTVFSSTSTPGDIQLSFGGTNTSFYTIERSFSSTSSYVFLATTSNTFYTDVAPGSGTWWYRVKGSNVYGSSAYSNDDFETLP